MSDGSADTPPLPAPPDLRPGEDALFADLDGTLAPIAPSPDAVGPDAGRSARLAALSSALGGRLAIVSGRGLADLDRILAGGVPALAAVHGLVRRSADGRVHRATGEDGVRAAADAFEAFAEATPGALAEDKELAAALHYRGAPQAADACHALASRLAAETGLVPQDGKMVVELRAPGPDKGEAVRAFMAEAPFAGARPVFLGDDLTDEDGFDAARRLGGYGIVVGPRRPTLAGFALPDVEAVWTWLARAGARTG
ncbi:MAG: trehalose-phosphatase [Caulobacteraceae bacterium]|nr:trehalose-phosphatase [Caulobacteraceae bacterium]